MRMNTHTWVLFFIFCFQTLSWSQESHTKELEEYFKGLEDNNECMGSVAIYRNNQLLYTRSIGYRDVENRVKADENSIYRIGSISKTFTAVLVFQAIEEGQISLEDVLADYFPTIENAGRIKIRHLLSHRSGIYDFTRNPFYLFWCTSPRSREEVLQTIYNGLVAFEPDDRTEYCNLNYVLLGYILEEIYGKPYSELILEKIAKPLGLSHTFHGSIIKPENNECYSYLYTTGSWEKCPETDMSIPSGAGSIVSTPLELVTFATALFSNQLISGNSMEQMMNIRNGMGMGLFSPSYAGKTAYGHGGTIDGFRAVFTYFPDDNLCIALACNGTAVSPDGIIVDILGCIYGKPESSDVKYYEVLPEDMEKYPGIYSCPELPHTFTVRRKDAGLEMQLTGQPSFPLSASGKHIFIYERANVRMEFFPEENRIYFTQRGMEFNLQKE